MMPGTCNVIAIAGNQRYIPESVRVCVYEARVKENEIC